MQRRRRTRRWLGVLAVMVVMPVISPVLWITLVVTPQVRGAIVSLLAERFGQDVEVGSLDWQFRPGLAISGGQVVVRRGAAAPDDPPLITLEAFRFDTSWRDLMASPRRIRRVEVSGLHVVIPAGRGEAPEGPARTEPVDTPLPERPGTTPEPSNANNEANEDATGSPVVVDLVAALDVRVEMGSSRADKPPRVFQVPELQVHSITTTGPIAFEAVVLNPTPPGRVEVSGSFGPWNRPEPSRTPIAGEYAFTGADLSVFRGVSGTLASTGSFEGVFDDIMVNGQATVPDFSLTIGQVSPLDTSFTARVSDRGGDIALDPVGATFGDTALDVRGAIVRSATEGGRVIDLDVVTSEGRIEDFLAMALEDDPPPISGPMTLQTRVRIPPGDERVIRKIELAGEFRIPRARFASLNVQRTLERISRVGSREGDGTAEAGESVVSDLAGTFTVRESVLTFAPVRFAVPGFAVRLDGTYDLVGRQLDLAGRVHIDRAPSELIPMPAGVRRAEWVRFVDQALADTTDGTGTSLPIAIRGPRNRPIFSVDTSALRRDLQQNFRQDLERSLGQGLDDLRDRLRDLLPDR